MSQQLRRFLTSGDALSRLQEHASRLRRLQTALESALPPTLAAQYRVANLKNDELVVFAQSGAAAVRLKQMVPSVLEQLNLAGHAIHAIKVKILSPDAQYAAAPRPPATRELSASAREHLTDFATSLPVDSELRQAIERLAQRARTR